MYSPYDDVGALGGLFAPAYIAGDPNSMTAVARWNAAHLKRRPAADPWMQSQPVVTNQRDAITQALVNQGSTMGALGVGGESGSISAGSDNAPQQAVQGPVTNLGIDPDNPTVNTNVTPPAVKGEPTPEQDAHDLAVNTQKGINEGFMTPEGVPGKGVTTTVTSLNNPQVAFDPTNLAPTDPNNPLNDPNSLTPTFTPNMTPPTVTEPDTGKEVSPVDAAQSQKGVPPSVVDAINAHLGITQAAQEKGYNEAAISNPAFATPAVGEKGSPTFGPVAPIGPPAPPAPPAPPSTPNVAVTQDDIDAAMAIATANELGTEVQSVPSVEATTVAPTAAQQADIGTAPAQGWSTPGITPSMAANIGTAPVGPNGYAAPNAVSPSQQAAASLAADLGISEAEAAANIAAQQDSVQGVPGVTFGDVGITAAPGLAIGPTSSPSDVATFGDNLSASIAAPNAEANQAAANAPADAPEGPSPGDDGDDGDGGVGPGLGGFGGDAGGAW